MNLPGSRLPALLLAAAIITTSAVAKDNGAPDDTAQVSAAPGKEFVYKQSGGVPQKLEVYFPEKRSGAKGKVPAVILFHGGGWSRGDLDQFRYACQYFASRGLVAITANYRMIPKKKRDTLPAGESYKRVCITDAKSAIRWIKQHADELGIDSQRIIAGGGSAGGHIALLATTNPGLNDSGDPKKFDTSVAAYLLFNPAFKGSDRSDPTVYAQQHLTADMPPAIFFFGDQDSWKKGADAVLQKLIELRNTDIELWIAEGQSHGFFNRTPWQDVTLTQADRFLVKHGFLSGSATLPAPPGGETLIQAP